MSEDVRSIASECTVILDKPPCCLEFSRRFPDYFVVGTYNLVSSTENIASEYSLAAESRPTSEPLRDGSLDVFKLVHNEM